MEKTKLVVLNGHSLGYINPQCPNTIYFFSHSVLEGAGCFLGWYSKEIWPSDNIRLASEKDFNFFRVCFNGYKTHPEQYEFQHPE